MTNIQDELWRCASFNSFPRDVDISCLMLAKSGFIYTGQNAETKCFSCGLIFKNWKSGDIPNVIHKSRSPSCAHIIQFEPIAPGILRIEAYAPKGRNSVIKTTLGIFENIFDISNRSNTNIPQFPNYSSNNIRNCTFQTWPKNLRNITRSMVSTGFFYVGYSDFTRCFHCGLRLQNWFKDCDPWAEHKRWSPFCQHLLQSYRTIPFKEEQDNTGQKRVGSASQLEECKASSSNDKACSGDPNLEENHQILLKNRTIEWGDPRTAVQDLEKLITENNNLRHQRLCKVCLEVDASEVFLPCGHLVCCSDCANVMHKCPICRSKVVEKKTIFLS
ncbi:E3 ubiquitin-protein ligase XIAP [Mytilus galloprovincialis]|uniref:E3 ubiquitin-protein ligase XIAP n=1 Tax=Mytilus galloprovincialis TaxID=29158 RepID=A0A8B6D679_MYTGA|nr:E3 ubiquitin-protein ligase XIAP [Mytilus galloprovincialis]